MRFQPIFPVLLASTLLQAQSTPVQLPGNGIAQHDFLYAGESHDRKIFIVRKGKVVWTYDDPSGKGEISDAIMLSNGNILFAHQFGVKLIAPDKRILWRYDPPPAHEVHTAVPIGKDRVLYIQNGDPTVLRVVNITTDTIEKEFSLPTKQPVSVHGQFRHARLTSQGTLLVAHMDLNKVVEYDSSGKELWSFPAPRAWGVEPLASGNILITDRLGVREVNRRGDSIWSWSPADTPAYHFNNLQLATRLPNGNTLINNWVNEWDKPPVGQTANDHSQTIQAIELGPQKQTVWILRQWAPPANLGPATTIQLLDQPSAPENVRFGTIQ
ncbi:MAG: hypothetical protein JWM43_1262 [Acidobacteriaceae bacterium]|nr:hypothetical protein [Acidobacteriaceae bacterium]